MDNINVTKNSALTAAVNEGAASPELRAAIAQFCRRRSIEAASALSLIALTSFSQAWALSVSELNVESSLGQPLRATLDIATSGGETINARCLRLSSPAEGGMPGVSGVSLAVSTRLNGATVRFSSSKPLREPMSEMTLNINCSGTPALSKSFLVMLDPPSLLAPAVPDRVAAQPTSVQPTTAQRNPSARPRRAAARVTARRGPIAAGTAYVVQPGDILSVIASRVEGRPSYSVWPIAQRIYDTNPAAFDGPQPDSLRVGATLFIPALNGRLAVPGSANEVRNIRLRRASATQAARPTPRTAAAVRRDAARNQPAAPRTITTPSPAPRASAALAIMNRQPVLRRYSYARDLSGLSMDRLRQRRAGNPFVVNFASNQTPPAPTPQPLPEAVAPLVTKNQEPTAEGIATTAPQGRFGLGSWLANGIVLLLGALLGALGTGLALRRWLATQKEEQEAEIARAKRHQTRLEETRQTRTATAAPAIVVHEELPRVDISAHPTMDAIGSIDEVVAAGASTAAIGALLEQDAAMENDDELSADTAADHSEHSEPDLSVDSIEPEPHLDYDVFEAPGEAELELLARDYAASVGNLGELEPDVDFGTTQALLTPEKMGIVENATEIIPSPLDLELPEGHVEDTELSIEALQNELAAVQIPGTTMDAGDESTEAMISLDQELLGLAEALEDDNDPTAEAQLITLDEGDQDNDPTSALPTRDSEDFYHLEASSIRQIDALGFEEEVDDDDTQLVSARN